MVSLLLLDVQVSLLRRVHEGYVGRDRRHRFKIVISLLNDRIEVGSCFVYQLGFVFVFVLIRALPELSERLPAIVEPELALALWLLA